MRRVVHVAVREFKATVLTKAFLIGVLIVPLLMMGAIPAAILLVSQKPPPVSGRVAIIDRSGGEGETSAAEAIRRRLSPEAVAAELESEGEEARRAIEENVPKPVRDAAGASTGAALAAATAQAKRDAPRLEPEVLAADSDVAGVKETLLPTGEKPGPNARVALLVVSPTAVRPDAATGEFGTFDLYVRPKLDARVQGLIRAQAREAVVQARLRANGLDPARIESLTRLRAPRSVEVTRSGDKSGGEMRQMLVPLGFMMLLWISVFTGGQFLLTSTIEEKSNRIMEVLLSAVSPLELMTGKILGQMAAAMTILLLYSGTGILALIYFAQQDLIDPVMLLCVGVFFVIAFFTIASMMAAVGSAVTDIHEAQSLMTPIMLVVMTPMLLMMPIIWNPGGALATTLSFVPPINPFVMVLRMASSDPPPMWQVLLSMGVGFATVWFMLKAAAKIFRVGVLMYGKPPNFATLIKWIRMA